MKWHLLLPLFVYTWLVGGCQALAGSESSVAITLEATKSAQPLITATSRPATRVPPTPTPDIAATVVALSPPRIHSSFPSADGKWRAEVLIYDCVKVDARESADVNAVELLRLIRLSDQTETVVETALLNCGCGGAHGIGGLFWSANDRYFYYTDARESARDGLCGYWARPIKRVDVAHQKVELVGGGHLSPDKTRLAFWQDNEIVIWSLDQGEVARAPAVTTEAFPNEISWSPDSQSLVYLQTELDCYPFGKSYVARLDLSGMKQNLLLESETPRFSWLTWEVPDQIRLVDDQGTVWKYNLISKELKPASRG